MVVVVALPLLELVAEELGVVDDDPSSLRQPTLVSAHAYDPSLNGKPEMSGDKWHNSQHPSKLAICPSGPPTICTRCRLPSE
jgi:hypothetical protein